MSTARRWWVYQRERFPVVRFGVMTAALVFTAMAYSSAARSDRGLVMPGPDGFSVSGFGVAAVCAFLLFFQLRIADEFKDRRDDAAYRPYRPVPRGLMGLRELGTAGAGAAFLEVVLVGWFDVALLPFLAAVWFWMTLMTAEFFVSAWLRARPALYMGSHLVIMPLIAFFASAFDWRAVRQPMPPELYWLFALVFCIGVLLETGRKIRRPDDEEKGVETYTALWGRKRAVGVWLASAGAAIACALGAAAWAGVLGAALIGSALVAGCALASAAQFLANPAGRRGQMFERISEGSAVVLLACLGAAALRLS